MIYPAPKKSTLHGEKKHYESLSVSGVCAELFVEAMKVYGYTVNEASDSVITIELDPSLEGIDAYKIVSGDKVVLTAKDENAAARGIWTLVSMISEAGDGYDVETGSVEDSAYMPFRGVHMFTPPRDGIEECKRIMAVAAKLKFNTIILEIGGGMELERHPEVNYAWTKFCREARSHVGGPQGIQGSEAYWKDSTHVELAGGGYITKKQMKELVEYCAHLHIEVIPEIQSLSHAYYLTLADRSIAERPFEPYPDSYCPSNPRSYELYFEVADEILEVIKPKRVSIGHDEVRVMGECPRCKGKSGAELLAGDLNKLHDFYKERGITIMMWGEKLQNFMNFKGFRMGGVREGDFTDRYGRYYVMPATDGAIDMIPNDIIMLDWYYSWGYDTEKDFIKRGFTELYGNFNGSKMADWDKRSKNSNVIGGEVSTWCIPDEGEIGHNGWFYELVFSSTLLWRDDFTDDKRYDMGMVTESMLPEIKRMVSGKGLFDGNKLDSLVLPAPGEKKAAALPVQPSVSISLAEKLAANSLGTADELHVDRKASSLVFFSAVTDCPKSREYTWFFLNPAPRMAASYSVFYEDGVTIRIPMIFPKGIGNYYSDAMFNRPVGDAAVSFDVDNNEKAKENNLSPMFAPNDCWRDATSYFSRVAMFATGEGIRSVYAYEWKNPRPDVKINEIKVIDEGCSPMNLMCFGVGTID